MSSAYSKKHKTHVSGNRTQFAKEAKRFQEKERRRKRGSSQLPPAPSR